MPSDEEALTEQGRARALARLDALVGAAARCRLERAVNSPGAVQRPHPPILRGGMDERRTLPLVARYAGACNLFDIPDGGRTIRHKLAVPVWHCDAIGRPYADIDKTMSTCLEANEPAGAFAGRTAVADLGIRYVVVITSGPWMEEAVGRLAAVAVRLS